MAKRTGRPADAAIVLSVTAREIKQLDGDTEIPCVRGQIAYITELQSLVLELSIICRMFRHISLPEASSC